MTTDARTAHLREALKARADGSLAEPGDGVRLVGVRRGVRCTTADWLRVAAEMMNRVDTKDLKGTCAAGSQ